MANPVWFVVVVLLMAQLKVYEKFMRWKNRGKEEIHPHRRREDAEENHFHKRFNDYSARLTELETLVRSYVADDKMRNLDVQRLSNNQSALQSKVDI